MSVSASVSEAGHMQPQKVIATTNSYDIHGYQYYNYTGGISEIEEENSSIKNGTSEAMESIIEENDQMVAFGHGREGSEDCVYVSVDKSEASVDALTWTLKNVVIHESTLVYLIHVFPETHHIPYPLGMLPKSQASPEQIQNYVAQETSKRREFLQKFLDLCSAAKVKVDTILIESDGSAKAILDLIPVLNIRKLILGTTKSDLRKLRSKRGSCAVDRILQNAPDFCEIQIISDGKEVIPNLMTGSPSPSPRGDDENTTKSPKFQRQSQPTNNDSFACMCFKVPKVM